MTRVLIDVTSRKGRFAISRDGAINVHPLVGPRHAESLIPDLQIALGSKPEIEAVGVITGPGSFTGIRIGIATAQGLARGWSAPLFASNLFDLVPAEIPKTAQLMVPAGRNRYYSCQQGVIRHVDGSDMDDWANVFGFGAGPFQSLPDPLLTLDQKIYRGELQPNPVPEAFYAKEPDAKKGTSLLQKLRLRGHRF